MARWIWLLPLLAALLLPTHAEPDEFARTLEPFLEDHCLRCHTGRRAKGKLDLSKHSDLADRAVWAKVRARLGRRDMPPDEDDRPPAAEYRRVAAWLDARLPRDPGRVTIRRLNRAEYQNTVRDLLGVAYDAAATFPADDSGYGFDNIGDVLSLPPVLLEKYLAAAEKIAAAAIVDEDPSRPAVRRIEAAELSFAGYGRLAADGRYAVLFAPGDMSATVTLPRTGEYLLRARAFGQQAGPDVARLTFRVDGKNRTSVAVPAVETEPGTYEHRARLRGGARKIGFGFYNDYYRPQDPDPKNRDRNLAVVWVEVVGPVDPPVLPAAHRRLLTKGATLKDVVRRLAPRAWRRPVADDEVARILATVERAAGEDATLARQVRLAITALLVSPHFLFRVELDPGGRRLDDFELASRLSYFLWSSMPDERLFAAAREGRLQDGKRLAAEVRRMLQDARASTLARNFASQWLQIRRLDQLEPDPARFPGVDANLKEAMRRETELFFEAILREDRSVWELLAADFTFMNERLAKLYGVAGVQGPFLRRVAVDGKRRGGILTHASVLTATSNPTRTSPVKRGKWVLQALLDAAPPPPPPGADKFDESPQASASAPLRERLEQHRADPACASCHLVMDEIGFSLENFDAVGRWRERDGKFAVDASAELPGGETFWGPAGLRRILRGDRRFLRSLAKHLLVYALGRGATLSDEAALDHLADTLEEDPRLSRLVTEVVLSDAFRMRGSQEAK